MLNIFLIKDKLNIGKRISELLKETEYGYEGFDWYNRLSILSDIEMKKPDIILLCVDSTDKDKYNVLEFLREVHLINTASQILIVVNKHSIDICSVAIDSDADWLLSLEEAEQLLEKVLHRMERKKDSIVKYYAEMKRYLFSAFVKDKGRLNYEEHRELFGEYQNEPFFQIVIAHVLPPYRKRNLLDENNVATLKGYNILDDRLKNISKYLVTKDRLDVIICLIGSSEELEKARRELNKYLRDMQEMNVALTKVAAWLSLGETVEQIEEIPRSYSSACALLNTRFFGGSIRLLESRVQSERTNDTKEQFWIYDVRKSLINALERLDETVIHKSLMQLKNNIISAVSFNEDDLYIIYRTLVSVFFKELESREINLSEYAIHYNSLLTEYDFFWNLEDLFSNLEGLYLEGIRILKEKEEKSAPSAIIQAKSYIRSYFNMPLTLEEVSAHVGMNENYFSDYFSKYMKMTFKQYLTELRIRYSKQLLLDRRYTMEDIAEAVGYNDVKYFSRVFKRIAGITPGEYRTRYHVNADH